MSTPLGGPLKAPNPFAGGKILVIDDEKANIRFLEIVLQQAGYREVYSSTDSRQTLALFREIQPDLVLLDLSMPHLDGFAVMQQLHAEMSAQKHEDSVPILVLTADSTRLTKHRALQSGARDFLTKPLDEIEVLLRIHNLLAMRFYSTQLESRVLERTRDLEAAQLDTLQRLAMASEYRDDNTGMHTKRVGLSAGCIARELDLPPAQVDLILRAAPLHDVGKIGIPDAILLKPGRLSSAEFEAMKGHTLIGAKLLSGQASPWLPMAEEVALTHHERFDGGGYPRALAGDSIPLVGRIVAVADVFDALTHERPYKRAWPIAQARQEIRAQSGAQFDADVVQAFLRCTAGRGE